MKLRVICIFGGDSVEHEISCISANQAMNALDKDKYEVYPIYINKSREMFFGEKLWNLKEYHDLKVLESNLAKVYLVKENSKTYIKFDNKKLFSKNKDLEFDVALVIMHGTNGEDGSIQGVLNMLDVPYTTSNLQAAAVSQDKIMMKQILQTEQVNMVDWFWFYGFDFEANKVEYLAKAEKIGYPVIVKPANLGSSIGISIAHNAEEFNKAVKDCFIFDDKLLVERLVKNLVEVNCSVLGNSRHQRASLIEEVIKNDEILSFNDKYSPKGGSKGSKTGTKGSKAVGSKGMASTSRIVPAQISDEQTKLVQEMAKKTFKVLGSSGVCRIDFIIDKSTDIVYVNEINTIPGSLANYLWKPLGMDFNILLDELIGIALENKREEKRKVSSFETNILANY